MAELHIKILKCMKKSGVGAARLRVGDVTISGPHELAKGDGVRLDARRRFTGSVQVTLTDVGEDLGTVTITDGQAGTGDRKVAFDAKLGADYHMMYDVHR